MRTKGNIQRIAHPPKILRSTNPSTSSPPRRNNSTPLGARRGSLFHRHASFIPTTTPPAPFSAVDDRCRHRMLITERGRSAEAIIRAMSSRVAVLTLVRRRSGGARVDDGRIIIHYRWPWNPTDALLPSKMTRKHDFSNSRWNRPVVDPGGLCPRPRR